jgi:hypothetical protein
MTIARMSCSLSVAPNGGIGVPGQPFLMLAAISASLPPCAHVSSSRLGADPPPPVAP